MKLPPNITTNRNNLTIKYATLFHDGFYQCKGTTAEKNIWSRHNSQFISFCHLVVANSKLLQLISSLICHKYNLFAKINYTLLV